MEPTATPSATASPTLTMVPTKDDVSDSAVLCPDVEPSNVSMLEVWWIYSVHFNADVDRTSAMTLFEMKLAAELEDEVLQCNGGRKSRRLEGREGIVGIDYLPLDEQLDEGKLSIAKLAMLQHAISHRIFSKFVPEFQ